MIYKIIFSKTLVLKTNNSILMNKKYYNNNVCNNSKKNRILIKFNQGICMHKIQQ